jgi:hypothetical protein
MTSHSNTFTGPDADADRNNQLKLLLQLRNAKLRLPTAQTPDPPPTAAASTVTLDGFRQFAEDVKSKIIDIGSVYYALVFYNYDVLSKVQLFTWHQVQNIFQIILFQVCVDAALLFYASFSESAIMHLRLTALICNLIAIRKVMLFSAKETAFIRFEMIRNLIFNAVFIVVIYILVLGQLLMNTF